MENETIEFKNETPLPTKLVIDRQRWYRGQGSAGSRLLVPEKGTMCCLGFFCLAQGFTADDIYNVTFPTSLCERLPREAEILMNSDESESADRDEPSFELLVGAINDDSNILDNEREAEITRLFGAKGIEVSFIN